VKKPRARLERHSARSLGGATGGNAGSARTPTAGGGGTTTPSAPGGQVQASVPSTSAPSTPSTRTGTGTSAPTVGIQLPAVKLGDGGSAPTSTVDAGPTVEQVTGTVQQTTETTTGVVQDTTDAVDGATQQILGG
jgi:hypothetical protein